MLATIIIIAIVVILGMFLITSYNSLVKYRNWVEESWSQIDVQLKRRHDLIPNLVNNVKGYDKHQKVTLEKVNQARNQSIRGPPQERIDPDNQDQRALQ